MSRQPTAKNRLRGPLKLLAEILRDSDAAPKREAEPSRATEYKRKIGRILAKSMETAFVEAGLDADKKAHRRLLLAFLSWAIYGGKDAGRPKKWTKKKLRRLSQAVDAIRADNPMLRDKEAVALLSWTDRYKTVKASTLRRTLARAKKLKTATTTPA